MKRWLVLILAVLVLASGAMVACGQKTDAPTSTTPYQVPPKSDLPPSNDLVNTKDWQTLNRWLHDLYRLPPVNNTEQLKSAAFEVANFWSDQVDKTTTKLEQNGIHWERTPPFCYIFNWYILHHIQLRHANTPMEFIAADYVLSETVKTLQDEAKDLMNRKISGEPINSFATEEEAMKQFKQIDKDYLRLLEEAIAK